MKAPDRGELESFWCVWPLLTFQSRYEASENERAESQREEVNIKDIYSHATIKANVGVSRGQEEEKDSLRRRKGLMRIPTPVPTTPSQQLSLDQEYWACASDFTSDARAAEVTEGG